MDCNQKTRSWKVGDAPCQCITRKSNIKYQMMGLMAEAKPRPALWPWKPNSWMPHSPSPCLWTPLWLKERPGDFPSVHLLPLGSSYPSIIQFCLQARWGWSGCKSSGWSIGGQSSSFLWAHHGPWKGTWASQGHLSPAFLPLCNDQKTRLHERRPFRQLPVGRTTSILADRECDVKKKKTPHDKVLNIPSGIQVLKCPVLASIKDGAQS